MPEPIDKELYKKVKKLADQRFESKTGVYKSSWIVKEYKRLGGKYKGKPTEKSGLKRWYKEDWVDLNRPIKDKSGKIIGYHQCGRKSILKNGKYPLCRPTKHVTFRTPRLVSEISSTFIEKAKREKQRVKGSKNIKFGGQPQQEEIKSPKLSKLSEQNIEEILKKIRERKRRLPKLPQQKTAEKIIKKYILFPEENKQKEQKERQDKIKEHKQKLLEKREKRKKKAELEKPDIEKMNVAIEQILPTKYEWAKPQTTKEGGKAQFYGKSSEIMIAVPKNVKKWAEQAFKLKELGFGGSLKTGWKRAVQLTTKESIPIEDLRYMRNWYARHIFASYPTFKEWTKSGKPNTKEWHNKHGIISWLTWGGNAGFNWVNSQKTINLLNKHFDKDYKKIKMK